MKSEAGLCIAQSCSGRMLALALLLPRMRQSMQDCTFPLKFSRRHDARRRWALIGLVVCSGTFRSGAAERVNPAAVLPQLGYEIVELRRTGENHLFLFGRVNGRRRSCLVDTGWSLATVSTNTARQLNPSGHIESLQLGRTVLTNETVVIQDLRINGLPAPYDVVLGCDFLIRHNAVLDCANRRLYLRCAAPSSAQMEEFELRLQSGGYVSTNLKPRAAQVLTCATRIDGHEVELLVDSGAMWSCLDTRTAQAMRLRSVRSPNRIMGAGAPGQRSLAVADLNVLEVGGCELRHVSVAVFSLTDWGLGSEGKALKSVGGILGGSELAIAGAVIDFSRLRLWLRSPD